MKEVFKSTWIAQKAKFSHMSDFVWEVCIFVGENRNFDRTGSRVLIVSVSKFSSFTNKQRRERSGSVVECLTRDRGAAGSSITGVTALCP